MTAPEDEPVAVCECCGQLSGHLGVEPWCYDCDHPSGEDHGAACDGNPEHDDSYDYDDDEVFQ